MSHTEKKETSAESHQKQKVLVIGHSMVNGISKKGLSRALLCKGNYFFLVTQVKELYNILNDLVIHTGTNDLTIIVKLLSNVKKIITLIY